MANPEEPDLSKLTAEELVEKTLDRAFGLAVRLTGNRSDAWDLTQETFVRAIAGLSGFRGESDPSTWVYRIMVNAWKNKVASRPWRWWRRVVSIDSDSLFEDAGKVLPYADDPAPEYALESAERTRRVERALQRLRPEDRAALMLREFEGKSYREIGEILGIPVGTVKSRLFHARSALADELESEDGA